MASKIDNGVRGREAGQGGHIVYAPGKEARLRGMTGGKAQRVNEARLRSIESEKLLVFVKRGNTDM
jgi:hypothetical protein